jgi:hypothetical protein
MVIWKIILRSMGRDIQKLDVGIDTGKPKARI